MEGLADAPTPFSADDYLARAKRVVASAAQEGLDGVLVTPGPDLVWLTGYQPTAITERLTVLVLASGQEPTLLIPALERPDAEAAEGAKGLALEDWADATDPYAAAADLLRPDGAYGVSDSAWALHLLGLQARLPGSRYRSLTECLPMMRAVKGAEELSGSPRRALRPTRHTARSSRAGSRGAVRPRSPPTSPRSCASSVTSRSTSPSSDPAPTAPTRTTRPATG